ncbi:MAG: class I SAM-dependent methyltransferase family protein, partial [Planctomycetota bacterium]
SGLAPAGRKAWPLRALDRFAIRLPGFSTGLRHGFTSWASMRFLVAGVDPIRPERKPRGLGTALGDAYFLSPGAEALRWRHRAVREAVANWAVSARCGINDPVLNVLDVGGGDGTQVRSALPGTWAGRYTLIESDTQAIAAARKAIANEGSTRASSLPFEALPPPNDGTALPAATLAVVSGVLELMSDEDAVDLLAGIHSSLRDGRSLGRVPVGLIGTAMMSHPHTALVRRCIAHDRGLGRTVSGPHFRTPGAMNVLYQEAGFQSHSLWRCDPTARVWVSWTAL